MDYHNNLRNYKSKKYCPHNIDLETEVKKRIYGTHSWQLAPPGGISDLWTTHTTGNSCKQGLP